MRPKLIILPDFNNELRPKGIWFRVFNIGNSVAKNCHAIITVIPFDNEKYMKTFEWCWKDYEMNANSLGNCENKLQVEGKFRDIYQKDDQRLEYLSIKDLYREALEANQKIPSLELAIRVLVYSEGITVPASYPIFLEWTGDCFNVFTNYIENDLDRVKSLRTKLNKEIKRELIKIRKSTF